MNRLHRLSVIASLLFCIAISRPLQAAEMCVRAPVGKPGSIPQPTLEWDVMEAPVITLLSPAGEDCELNLSIDKASRFTLKLKQLDQENYWAGFSIKIEKMQEDRANSAISAVDKTQEANTYIVFDPGRYVVRLIRGYSLYSSESVKQKRPKLKLSFSGYEPLPQVIPALNEGDILVVNAKPSENTHVVPFRLTQRSWLRMRFASVCYPDSFGIIPPQYSLQEIAKCKKFGIEPDPSAGSNIPAFQVDILDSRGRLFKPLWSDFDKPQKDQRLLSRHQELAAILPEGHYSMRVTRVYRGSFYEDLQSGPVNMTVNVSELKPEPLSPEMQEFDTWLNTTGLREHFFVVDIYTADLTKSNSCATRREKESQNVLFDVAKARQSLSGVEKENISSDRIEIVRTPCVPETEPVRISLSNCPTVLIRLNTTMDRFGIRKLETDFYAKFGATLWDRMLLKVSAILQVPLRKVVMNVPVDCSASLVYWDKGSAWRHGSECMSGGASTLFVNLSSLAIASQSSIASRTPRIGELTSVFIEKFYKEKGAAVQFLDRSSNFVEAIIRGLRGEVILGGKEWERIQVVVFALQAEKDTIELRALVDGRIASGLGTYPPDSTFTTDMEPRYLGALTEYARRLLDSIKAAVARKEPSK